MEIIQPKKKILYIDAFNVFYQQLAVGEAKDPNGEPIGAFIGTINHIQRLAEKFTPSKIVVVFDGPNAGARRRTVFKDYKGKRNRKKRYSIMDFGGGDKVEVDNEQEQLRNLYEFLKLLPVDIIAIPTYEADDIIAYLVNKNTEYTSIINTNDKDYYQLINQDTFVWASQKKTLYNEALVLAQHEVIPNNFVFMRCIVGDPSDKLIGIKGVGKKTLLDKIPQLKTQPFANFEEFWAEVDNLEDDSKLGKKLKENKAQAFMMYKLMKLDYTCMSQKGIEILESQLEDCATKGFSKVGLKMYCIKQHIESHIKNFDLWIRPFNFMKQDIKLKS
jgi:DNA polymerase-1